MKKFIGMLLVMISLLQMSVVWAEENDSTALDETISKLQYFEMIEPGMSAKQSQTLTRGEFSRYLLYYLGKNPVPQAMTSYYYDVPVTPEYASYINYMLDLGYAKKDAVGLFYPDELISVRDAGMFLLRAMGYGSFIDTSKNNQTISNAYSRLVKGVAQNGEKITVGGVIKMFDNALDVPVYTISGATENGGISFSGDEIFLNAYFKIYKVRGRVNATRLTSLDSSISLNGNEAAIDSNIYAVADNMSHISDYLGFYIDAYYRENDDKEYEIVYFEDFKTGEFVIKASEFISYEDNKITYLKEDAAKSRTVSFEPGAYVIYNGQLIDSYTSDIFDIENGSIELVGQGEKYDVVKIYDYTDIVIGGVSLDTGIIYSQYSDVTYDTTEYENVIIRDRYGRNMSMEELAPEMVASVGESGDKELLIINISDSKITGILTNIDIEEETVWTIDGREYKFNGSLKYAQSPLNAEVTVYLNYLDRIAYIISGKNDSGMYGYLIKANQNDTLDALVVKIYTESGRIEDYNTKDKITIDGEKYSGADALRMLSYEQPTSLTPSGEVQPQLVKYNVNSDGILTKIDTARVGERESEETTLAKNISNEERFFLNDNSRLMGKGNDKSKFALDCLVTDNTKIFVVPGNIQEAKIEYDAYSIASKSYFRHEGTYYIDTYDTDYLNGAEPKVIVVRLDSTVAYPNIVPFGNMMVVTSVGKTIDEEDNIVTEVTGYSYSQNATVSVKDYIKANVFENSGVAPGDIIRYGYVNDNITGCEIDMKMSDPNQFTPGYSTAPRIAANWHYDHFFATYRITVGQIVDISGSYMYFSDAATDRSTMEDCKMLFDLTNTKIFVFDADSSRNKLEQIDAARLREYTYRNNQNAKAAVYTSFADAKMVVVYI